MLSIKYYSDDKAFHLTNGKLSYVMNVLRNEQLGHVYFGKAIEYIEAQQFVVNIDNIDEYIY